MSDPDFRNIIVKRPPFGGGHSSAHPGHVSPAAERMLQMVTQGFYDRSYIGLWLYEVIGREYDEMDEWSQSLRFEAFPQTCTWSIGVWEFIYDIPVDDTLPLEYRRARIKARRLRRPPINPARIEAVLSALTGCPVTVTDPIAAYTFSFEIDESELAFPLNYRAATELLREIKPSHLSYKFGSIISVTFTAYDYDAGAMADYVVEFFIGDESEIQTDITEYSAGAEAALLKEFMSENYPIIETAGAFDAGAENALLAEVFTE